MANIKQVAESAGVSISTVSRVFSDKPTYVAEETKAKVLEAAEKLNYTPNVQARSLRGGPSNNIAIIISNIENDMYPPIIRGAEVYLRKQNYNLILCDINEDIDTEKYYINKLKNSVVDGFIICSMMKNSEHIRQLQRDKFPIVLVSRYYGDKINAVIIDNYQAAYNATKYLINSGNKRIALVLGRTDLNIYSMRFEGYKAAIKEAGIEYDEDLIVYDTDSVNSLYNKIAELLKKDNRPTAIFATSDSKAIVSMNAVHDVGLSIPDDVSILGFDNIKVSKLLNPPLSTVSQPFYDMGQLAAKKLINIINGIGPDEPVVDCVETEIIIRKTTK